MKQKSRFLENISMESRPGVRYWVPAAAMDEADFREEIRRLYERGFGRIELVVLSGRNAELDHSEDGWGTENWDKMVRIAADETEKLGMKLDIANGPGWPISSPVIKDADDPAALRELTYGEMALPCGTHYEGPLPERKKIRPEGTPKLVALMAYPEIGEKLLDQAGYIDLTPFVSEDGKTMKFDLPAAAEASEKNCDTYRIFAFYEQPAVQKINSGMYYVIDHLGKAGAEACRAYWDPIFKKYDYPSMESFFCDSLEYAVTLEWTPGFAEYFEKKFGYDLRPWLPVIGEHEQVLSVPQVPGYHFENREICEMVNREFMEALTDCYGENHLRGLEEMANAYGKTIRYQVAYNKPLEEEISAYYPGIPENEALGRPTLDGQKTMAAAAHLGRKKRYSFECAAEFGFGYNQTYEDLFWWVKRALMAGMNAEVLHGASYSGAYHGTLSENGKVPGASWPGYEGFGRFVSNNWNRTLSVKDARSCIDAIARMNQVFLEKAKVDAAVLRSSYVNTGEGPEFNFYPDDGKLSKAGYSYEFVTEKLLNLPVCEVQNGELDPDGPGYRALVVMPGVELSLEGIRRIRELREAGLLVIFCEAAYDCRFYSDYADPKRRDAFERELRVLLDSAETDGCLSSIDRVPETLKNHGILPRTALQAEHDMITALHETETERFHALYSYNRIGFDRTEVDTEGFHPDLEVRSTGNLRSETLKSGYKKPGKKSLERVCVSLEKPKFVGEDQLAERKDHTYGVFLLDPWTGTEEQLAFREKDGRLEGTVMLQEDEMLILSVRKIDGDFAEASADEILPEGKDLFMLKPVKTIPIRFSRLSLYEFGPLKEDEVSFLRSGFGREGRTYLIDEAKAFSEVDPGLEHFAGKGVYEGSFIIDQWQEARYQLRLGKVSDTAEVIVNGQTAEGFDQVFDRADITAYLHPGENTISVRVVTNLNARLTENFDPARFRHLPFGMPDLDHRYGMWEEDDFTIGIDICE